MQHRQVTGEDHPAGSQVVKHFHGAADLGGIAAAAARDGVLIGHQQYVAGRLVQGELHLGHESGEDHVLQPNGVDARLPALNILRFAAHPQEADLRQFTGQFK